MFLFERKLASSQRDTEPRTYVNKLFCSENKHKEFLQIFFLKRIFIVVLIFFVNTWKFIVKQLVASGSVITSLYSLRLRASEYRLVITSPSATNCFFRSMTGLDDGFHVIGETPKCFDILVCKWRVV